MSRNIKTIMTLLSIVIGILNADISLSQCTIGTTAVSFGNYDVFLSIPTDATGTITVNCLRRENKATVTLGVSSTSGTFNPRRMKRSGGNDLLDYNIYTDPARTLILGNGTGGTSDIGLKRPTGPPADWSENIIIYGRIPPGQDVSAGTYSDTLMATVDW
jgi:spore coat protein U-like protein